MAWGRRLLRKDALLVFLVLLVAGLLMERFGGDDTLLRWLGKPAGQLVEYVPVSGAPARSAEVAHTAPLLNQVDVTVIPESALLFRRSAWSVYAPESGKLLCPPFPCP